MRLGSSYAYQKKDDDHRDSSDTHASGSRSGYCALFITQNKRPTVLSWIIIVLCAVYVWYTREAGSGDAEAPVYVPDINPRFRVLNPQVPEPQLDEYKAQHEKNLRKPGRRAHVEAPFFDPNKHPVPQEVKNAQLREPHKPPMVKEYPVMITHRPDVNFICKDNFELLVILDSVTEDVSIRETIRATWASSRNEADSKWSLVFVSGGVKDDHHLVDRIRLSDSKQKDMLRGDFLDTHHENTRKLLLSMDWVMKELLPRCQPKFILISQERIFHNVASILKMIKLYYPDPQTPLYVGRLLRGDVPIRDSGDIMYVSEEDFAKDTFPDMISKPVYLLSLTALKMMYDVRSRVTPIAATEAYIGLLAEAANIKPTENDQFVMMRMSQTLAKCHFVHREFVYDVNVRDLKKIYKKYLEELRSCPA